MPDEAVYTHGHDDSVLRSHRWRTAANSAAYLVPRLEPGMTLLDVGCGPGTLTFDLARQVAPGLVRGMDTSAEVIDAARAYAAEEGGADNLGFAVGDLFAPVERDEDGLEPGVRFDVVHAHQVVQHVADPVAALVAMARLAGPGGLVAVRDADYGAMTWAPDDERLDRWLALTRDVTRRNGGEPDAGRYLSQWAHEAGLHDVVYTTSTWTFTTVEERRWWGDLWAERTVASAMAARAREYGVATESDLAGMAAGWRAWAETPGAQFTVPHGEILARAPGPDRREHF